VQSLQLVSGSGTDLRCGIASSDHSPSVTGTQVHYSFKIKESLVNVYTNPYDVNGCVRFGITPFFSCCLFYAPLQM
jgi:hypothetical protein